MRYVHLRVTLLCLLSLGTLVLAQGDTLPLCTPDDEGIKVSELEIDGSGKPQIAQLGEQGNVRHLSREIMQCFEPRSVSSIMFMQKIDAFVSSCYDPSPVYARTCVFSFDRVFRSSRLMIFTHILSLDDHRSQQRWHRLDESQSRCELQQDELQGSLLCHRDIR